MSGIEGVSAILAVAEIGLSLSSTIYAYVNDVKGAHSTIRSIASEVATTSERLKELHKIIHKNKKTFALGPEGIQSAIRLSGECSKILGDLREILIKGGWREGQNGSQEDEIDTSWFSSLRWPLLGLRLEVPGTELKRIKADISLCLTTNMLLQGTSVSHRARYEQDISRLERMKKNASELTEQATERARYFMDGLSLDDDGEKDGLQEESEYLQILIQHEEKRVQEEEERRLEERAEELLQEKEEVMRKAAEDRRQLEKGIVEKYKNEQKQIQERAAKRQRKICMDLKDSGLTPDQLNAVLAKLAIMDNAADDPSNPGQGPPAFPPKKDPHEATPVKSYGKNGQIHPVTIHRRGRWQWRKKLPWRHRMRSRSPDPPPNSTSSLVDTKIDKPPKLVSLESENIEMEAWLLDVYSQENIEVWPSSELKRIAKSHYGSRLDATGNAWQEFAALKPMWRTSIMKFLNSKNNHTGRLWTLLSVKRPRKFSRASNFGWRFDNHFVQVIVSRKGFHHLPRGIGDCNRPMPTSDSVSSDLPLDPKQIYRGRDIGVIANSSKNINTNNERRLTGRQAQQMRRESPTPRSMDSPGIDYAPDRITEAQNLDFMGDRELHAQTPHAVHQDETRLKKKEYYTVDEHPYSPRLCRKESHHSFERHRSDSDWKDQGIPSDSYPESRRNYRSKLRRRSLKEGGIFSRQVYPAEKSTAPRQITYSVKSPNPNDNRAVVLHPNSSRRPMDYLPDPVKAKSPRIRRSPYLGLIISPSHHCTIAPSTIDHRPSSIVQYDCDRQRVFFFPEEGQKAVPKWWADLRSPQ